MVAVTYLSRVFKGIWFEKVVVATVPANLKLGTRPKGCSFGLGLGNSCATSRVARKHERFVGEEEEEGEK